MRSFLIFSSIAVTSWVILTSVGCLPSLHTPRTPLGDFVPAEVVLDGREITPRSEGLPYVLAVLAETEMAIILHEYAFSSAIQILILLDPSEKQLLVRSFSIRVLSDQDVLIDETRNLGAVYKGESGPELKAPKLPVRLSHLDVIVPRFEKDTISPGNHLIMHLRFHTEGGESPDHELRIEGHFEDDLSRGIQEKIDHFNRLSSAVNSRTIGSTLDERELWAPRSAL